MESGLTKHAEQRCQQRGISKATLEQVSRYGEIEYTYKKRLKVFLSSRDTKKEIMRLKWEIENSKETKRIMKLRKAIKTLQRAAGKTLIEENGKIVTIYVQYKADKKMSN